MSRAVASLLCCAVAASTACGNPRLDTTGSDGLNPADTPAPDTGFTPPGKGLWIWRFDYTGKTPSEVAGIAHAAGVGYVLIKSGQDASYWSTRFNADSVKPFTDLGMRVIAWPYVTPADVPGAITATAAAAAVPGVFGVVLDVEIEWEEGGDHSQDAAALCDGIRQAQHGVWLGFTSFGWIDRHPAFPWHAFDGHCGDAFFPQVYWSDRGVDWKTGYDDALSGLAKVGIKAPLWLAQSNDDIHASNMGPTTNDLNAFFDLAGARASLWVFPNSDTPDKVSQLSALHWKN